MRSIHEIKHQVQGLSREYKIQCLSEQLAKMTHFTKDECKTLLHLHSRLESNGPLDRHRFQEILHVIFEITDYIMLDLTFNAFDKDNDGFVDDIEFVRGFSAMLRGTSDELIEFCYFIYDMNGDGGLCREEIAHCLKGCILPGYGGVGPDDVEESERDILELAMRKLDVDRDGQISLQDFKAAVKKDPLLIESIGPCLPPVRSCATFLSLITAKFRSYTGATLNIRNSFRKNRCSITKNFLGQSTSSTTTVDRSLSSNFAELMYLTDISDIAEARSMHNEMISELSDDFLKNTVRMSIPSAGTLSRHMISSMRIAAR